MGDSEDGINASATTKYVEYPAKQTTGIFKARIVQLIPSSLFKVRPMEQRPAIKLEQRRVSSVVVARPT